MTDTRQNPSRLATSSSRKKLEGAFSKEVVDAIAGVAREEATAILQGAMSDLEKLVAKQHETILATHALPPEKREEVASQVDEATSELKAVVLQANEQADRQNKGEPVESDEVEDTKERATRAGDKVAKAKSAVDERISRHEAVLAPRKGSDKDSRLDDIEADVAGIRAELDQLSAGHDEVRVVSVAAYASAQASSGSDDAMRRSAQTAGVVFVVTLLLYLLTLVGDAKWDWNWAIGLPAVMAGIAGVIVWMLTRPDGLLATSVAAADAIVARWSKSNDDSSGRSDSSDDQEGLLRSEDGNIRLRESGASASASASSRDRQSV